MAMAQAKLELTNGKSLGLWITSIFIIFTMSYMQIRAHAFQVIINFLGDEHANMLT